MQVNYAAVVAAFDGTGLLVRGGCLWQNGSIVLLGQAGAGIWPHFVTGRRNEDHPLDGWTKRIVTPIAAALNAAPVFPSDKPFAPFLSWAVAAEPVASSPLGLLIHPDYGLWHAYRAALYFALPLPGLPARSDRPSPCETCAGRPCLTACPVGAFSGARYDIAACADHLARHAEPDCAAIGCRARAACPVGRNWQYSADQIAFHMTAFAAARDVSRPGARKL